MFLLATAALLLLSSAHLRFQRLVNESSAIADKQCMNVNPLIIKRKKSFIKSTRSIMQEGNIEDYWKEQENYVVISNAYVAAQTKWLDEQEAFMNRWDYKLLVPKQVKAAEKWQFEARKADKESTIATVAMFSTSNERQMRELEKILNTEVAKRNKAEAEYQKILDAKQPFSLIWFNIKVPSSKCPPENFNIPDVNEFIEPENPVLPDGITS